MTIAVDINEVLRDYLRAFKKQYNKVVNPDFEIEYDDINDFDLMNIFPFTDEEGYPNLSAFNSFRFEDCAFEIYSRADLMERDLPAFFNMWINGALRNFDEEKNPNVILFSPFEMNLTIPSTLDFWLVWVFVVVILNFQLIVLKCGIKRTLLLLLTQTLSIQHLKENIHLRLMPLITRK